MNTETQVIYLRLDKDTKEYFKEQADRLGLSLNSYIRMRLLQMKETEKTTNANWDFMFPLRP